MTQIRIFISHSSQDKSFTGALVQALRDSGADVWYDEHDLGPGQLRETISRELSSRDAFIVVLSKAALSSTWVRDECNWAYNLYQQQRITKYVPVLVESLTERDFDVMLFLDNLKRVEAPGYQPYPHGEAIAHVLRLLALASMPSPFGKMQTATLHTVYTMTAFTETVRMVRHLLAQQETSNTNTLKHLDRLVGALHDTSSQLLQELQRVDQPLDAESAAYGMDILSRLLDEARWLTNKLTHEKVARLKHPR